MPYPFIMDASKLNSFVHALCLPGRLFTDQQKCEVLHNCLIGFAWVLLYLDWLFRNFPILCLLLSTLLNILQTIFSVFYLLILYSKNYIINFMGLLLFELFRRRNRKNYKRLRDFVNRSRRLIMGTIWGSSIHKGKASSLRDLNKVEVLPSHIYTQRSIGAYISDDLFENDNTLDSHCRCCPSPRSGHRSISDLDYVYVIGGYNALINGTTTMREIWRLNTITNAWERINVEGSFPDTMASFVVAQRLCYSIRHSLIFGGTGFPFGLSASNNLYSLREDSNGQLRITEENTAGNSPPPCYGSSFVAADDKTFYLIGGTTGHEYNLEVWKLSWNLADQCWHWTQLTKPYYGSPEGRYRHEAILTKDLILIFGGGTPQWSEQLEKLIAYKITDNLFIEIPSKQDPKHGFPPPRKCHAVVRYEDDVFIIGGCNEPHDVEFVGAQFYKVLNDLWKINLTTMHWTKLNTNLVNGVFFHSATVTFEGCIYIFGGCCDGRSAVRTNCVQRVWIRPPTLRRLAMEIIVENMPEVVIKFPDQIRISNVAGVVRNFCNHLNSNAA